MPLSDDVLAHCQGNVDLADLLCKDAEAVRIEAEKRYTFADEWMDAYAKVMRACKAYKRAYELAAGLKKPGQP